jgi:hypothetical protein
MLRLWRLGEQVTVKTTKGNPYNRKALRRRRKRNRRRIIIRVQIKVTHNISEQALKCGRRTPTRRYKKVGG